MYRVCRVKKKNCVSTRIFFSCFFTRGFQFLRVALEKYSNGIIIICDDEEENLRENNARGRALVV